MAAYKTKCTRNEDGSYTLSYGRQSKKLAAQLVQHGKEWFIPGFPPVNQKKKAVAAWAAWAEKSYGDGEPGKTETAETGPSPKPPAPPFGKRLPPPPSIVKKGPPSITKSGPPILGKRPEPQPEPQPEPSLEDSIAADPFDPVFRYPADHPIHMKAKHLTPLGVLVHIQAWCKRYEERIKDVNFALAAKKSPGFNPFYTLIEGINDCLKREIPLLHKEKPDDSAPATETAADRLAAVNLRRVLKRDTGIDPGDIPF